MLSHTVARVLTDDQTKVSKFGCVCYLVTQLLLLCAHCASRSLQAHEPSWSPKARKCRRGSWAGHGCCCCQAHEPRGGTQDSSQRCCGRWQSERTASGRSQADSGERAASAAWEPSQENQDLVFWILFTVEMCTNNVANVTTAEMSAVSVQVQDARCGLQFALRQLAYNRSCTLDIVIRYESRWEELTCGHPAVCELWIEALHIGCSTWLGTYCL